MKKNLHHELQLPLGDEFVTKTVAQWIEQRPRLLWKMLYTKGKTFSVSLTDDAYEKLKQRLEEQNQKILKTIKL